jgi:hypothetical protein
LVQEWVQIFDKHNGINTAALPDMLWLADVKKLRSQLSNVPAIDPSGAIGVCLILATRERLAPKPLSRWKKS